jgi:hypothetical protein
MDEGLDVSVDAGAGFDLPVSESTDMAELQNEAAALEIQPLEEGNAIEERQFEPSALQNILTEGAAGASSPGTWADVTASIIGKPGAGEAIAQGLQAGLNMGIAGSREFMAGVNETYGNPVGDLQNIRIQQSIEEGACDAGYPEPLADNEPVYDENGVDLTDESLRE